MIIAVVLFFVTLRNSGVAPMWAVQDQIKEYAIVVILDFNDFQVIGIICYFQFLFTSTLAWATIKQKLLQLCRSKPE